MRAKPGGRASGACVVCCALLVLLVGCGPTAAPDPRPLVVASILPLAAVVEGVAGASVRIEALLPPGAAPATYEPSLAQRRDVERAVLVVAVGHPRFPFERAWLDSLLADRPELPVLEGAAQVSDVDPHDPHWWLSPRLVRAFLPRLERELAGVLPAHASEFAANRARLQQEIDGLDDELRALLAPARGGRFFVHHPAWGYFAGGYGLEQVAVEHAGKEPGVRQLADLIEQMRRLEVEVMFVAPQFDASAARVVARETGARIEVLDPLARDWSGNLRRAARQITRAAVR